MGVFLADSAGTATVAVSLVGAVLLAAAGVVLLVIGVRGRPSGGQTLTGYPTGYPPAVGYPTPGYPPYPMAPYPPTPQPPRKSTTGLIVGGAVCVVLGALVIAGTVAANVGRSARLSVGDCFTNEILDKSRWQATSCRDADAVLEYAATTDSTGNCPDGKLNKSSYLSVERDGARRCFIPNLLENHCYASERNDESVRPVSCGTAGRVVKVVKRVDGNVDASACPDGSRTVTFPQPKRTYCTERTTGFI